MADGARAGVTDETASPRSAPSRLLLAEAAAWIVKLNGPDRSPDMDVEFDNWLQQSEDHRAALGVVAQAWEQSGHVLRRRYKGQKKYYGYAARVAGATLAAIVLVVVGVTFYFRPAVFSTAVGEQRLVKMVDGSRVLLNTATSLKVSFRGHLRLIQLDVGEARFNVAPDGGRPFKVQAKEGEITAIGPSFTLRRDPDRLAVIPIRGQVKVVATPTVQRVAMKQPPETEFVLSAGERLTLTDDGTAKREPVELKQVVAWEKRQHLFENVSLEDAVKDVNRYSKLHLVIEDPRAAALTVQGSYDIGDPRGFAIAMAAMLPVSLHEQADRIVLYYEPRKIQASR